MGRIHTFVSSLNIGLTLEQELNSGSFGTVYSGRFRGEKVAVKVERISKTESLETEYEIYQRVHSDRQCRYVGIPRCLHYDTDDKHYRLLVLPYMGRNLRDLVAEAPRHRFSSETTALIALQVLDHLEHLHSKGVVHRDIKPANLIVGGDAGLDRACIYLVDFGLSKVYIDLETSKHIPNRRYRGVTGTLRYMGLHAHESQEASRRDDLQALAYMLIYLVKGSLPWQDVLNSAGPYSKREQRGKVYHMKKQISNAELCAGLPSPFQKLLDYSNALEFAEAPDYGLIKTIFFDFLMTNYRHVRYEFDWMRKSKDEAAAPNSSSRQKSRAVAAA